MNTPNEFKQIKHGDSQGVISFENGTAFKISNFMEKLNAFLRLNVLNDLSQKLTQNGLGTPPDHKQSWNKSVSAEILEPASTQWKKGQIRVRIVLEFCPDQPEEIKNDILQLDNNSLDDIRQTIS